MTLYGYARVSTDGQTLDAQVTALKAAGAERVFSEKQSGADRAALAKALAVLNAGDVPVVKKAGQARPKHQGPPKRPGDGLGERGGLPGARRSVGRHHHSARKADAHGPRGIGGVRAEPDPDQNR
jgi:hypothetical protein